MTIAEMRFILLLALFSGLLIPFNSPAQSAPEAAQDNRADAILSAWHDGTTKRAIIDFVESVCDPSSADFVEPENRVAAFDNDGTLWSEQPMYFQLIYCLDAVRKLAPENPDWKDKQPFKAVIENDMETMKSFHTHDLLELVAATHSGMTTDEFNQSVGEWMEHARHPVTNKPYTSMVYQPMLQLIDYLHANEFGVFIVSGGGVDFLRVWAPEVYGIPTERIIGSSLKAEFRDENGSYSIVKLPDINFIDDKEGKPVAIHQYVGKRPIAAFGNSDGDLQMIQWTTSGMGRRLGVYLHHTDAEREWAYDRGSSIGGLDKGLDQAREKGWLIVDMKKDWKEVYPAD